MKNLINKELVNDVLTGVLLAATFAAVIPAEAFADLNATVGTAQSNVAAPAMKFLGMISYAVGGVITVAGIAGAKKHADNPGSNPLGPAVGKLCAGAAFLAAPSAIGVISSTGSNALGSTASTFTANSIGF